MIHTIELFFPITKHEVVYLQQTHGVRFDNIEEHFLKDYPAFTSLYISNKGKGGWKLYAIVDLIKLLERHSFCEMDYPTVEHRIKQFLRLLFGHATAFKEHVLKRIDYRKDIVIPNKTERLAFFHFYSKCASKHGFHMKSTGRKTEDNKYEAYETTQYFYTKNSVDLCIYCKETERIDKAKPIKDYEKDVLRFEVRVKQDHINQKARGGGKGVERPKQLEAYMNDTVYQFYMEKYVTPFIYQGDYYKIYLAKKIINDSKLSRLWKEKLIDFAKQVSNNGIDHAKKSMSEPAFNTRIDLLQTLHINPILIPKNRTDFPSFMQNPFQLDSKRRE